MDVKIKVKAMRKSEIPGCYDQGEGIYTQFTGIIEEFNKSESECISLLSGEPVDEKTIRSLQIHVKKAIKSLGLEGKMRCTARTKHNNLYVVKEGE